MLLRRWREGEHLGRAYFFSAPLCHTSTRLVKTAARLVDPRRWINSLSAGLGFECNFWSPTLFIDFDLRDSDVGVPQRCLLPSETTAPTACRQTQGCSIGAHLYPFVAVKKKKKKSGVVVLIQILVMNPAAPNWRQSSSQHTPPQRATSAPSNTSYLFIKGAMVFVTCHQCRDGYMWQRSACIYSPVEMCGCKQSMRTKHGAWHYYDASHSNLAPVIWPSWYR